MIVLKALTDEPKYDVAWKDLAVGADYYWRVINLLATSPASGQSPTFKFTTAAAARPAPPAEKKPFAVPPGLFLRESFLDAPVNKPATVSFLKSKGADPTYRLAFALGWQDP